MFRSELEDAARQAAGSPTWVHEPLLHSLREVDEILVDLSEADITIDAATVIVERAAAALDLWRAFREESGRHRSSILPRH
jgi:hypothetical protein